MSDIRTVKTACRACHGGCGAIVTLEGDRVTQIRPDPDSPLSRGRMCPKGLAGVDLLYSEKRLKYPMRRAGARGEGKWERITWDEAYDILAEKLTEAKNRYGMESVAIAQGTGRHHFHHVARFAHTLGTPNWFEPGTAQCFFPRVTAGNLTYGHPGVVDYYGEVNPDLILVWGTNPVVSGADCEIQFRVRDAIRKGSRLLVVDPRRTELAEKAELWLQVRPGTDAALALGMLHVIINEGLYDREFVEKWTYGFGQLRERVQAYPPARVSAITWIPEEQIVRAARLFAAAKPATLEWGCAVEHTPNCFQTVRAIAMLPGLCGHFDVPGGFIEGMHMMPDCTPNLDRLSDGQKRRRLGCAEYPLLAGADMGFPSAHIPAVFEAMRTGKPYPVRTLLLFGNNGLLGFADSQRTYETLRGLDFVCCMDLFMTPTAHLLADLVLPAASWLELDTVYSGPTFADYVVLCQKKLTRIGECKADEEVFCELCARLGLDYGAKTVHDILNTQLDAVSEKYAQYRGVDFERLKELNYLKIPVEYRQYEKHGRFDTPTGKMELYSTVMEKYGLDPLPSYAEPPESPYSAPEVAEEFPLILTTGGRSPYYFLSEGRQLARNRKLAPYPVVELHPETAAKYGIADGDWVFIETRRGKITQKALITDGIDPRVVNCQHGWWYPEAEGEDFDWKRSNANVLTCADGPYDPNMGTYQLRALLCRISRNPDTGIERRFLESDLSCHATGR